MRFLKSPKNTLEKQTLVCEAHVTFSYTDSIANGDTRHFKQFHNFSGMSRMALNQMQVTFNKLHRLSPHDKRGQKIAVLLTLKGDRNSYHNLSPRNHQNTTKWIIIRLSI